MWMMNLIWTILFQLQKLMTGRLMFFFGSTQMFLSPQILVRAFKLRFSRAVSLSTTSLLPCFWSLDPPKILVIEGLHRMFDERVRDVLDFSNHLDISNEVKFAWKIQTDMRREDRALKALKPVSKPGNPISMPISILKSNMLMQ